MLTQQPLQLPSVPTTEKEPARASVTVLVVCGPAHTGGRLHFDKELRAIDQAVLKAKNRSQVSLEPCLALSLSDLNLELLQHTPSIVHFSSQASKEGRITFAADDSPNARLASATELSSIFQARAQPIRCVVMNSCFSPEQGLAIAEHVECVIGTPRSMSDSAAIAFCEAFYWALASGLPVGKAFAYGKNVIGPQSRFTEQTAPVLLTHPGADRLCLTT
jgi:hypothetical protein